MWNSVIIQVRRNIDLRIYVYLSLIFLFFVLEWGFIFRHSSDFVQVGSLLDSLLWYCDLFITFSSYFSKLNYLMAQNWWLQLAHSPNNRKKPTCIQNAIALDSVKWRNCIWNQEKLSCVVEQSKMLQVPVNFKMQC